MLKIDLVKDKFNVAMPSLVEGRKYTQIPQHASELVIQQPLKESSFGEQVLEFLKNIWGAFRSYFSCDGACIEALLFAVENGDRGLVRGLLLRGVNPSQTGGSGETPLQAAYNKNDVPMVLRLLKQGAKPVYTGSPILCHAIRQGNKKMISALVETEMVDLNASDRAGMTPLVLAYRRDDFDLMQELMQRGAVHHFVENSCLNIFHKAVEDKKDALALKLLEAGLVKVDPQSAEDQTAFAKAMSFQNGALVQAMVAKGFSVNAKDLQGLTPLFHAFANKNQALALALAQHGAGYIVLPKEGDAVSLFMQAVKNGWSDVAAALLGNTKKMLDEDAYLITTKTKKPALYEDCRASVKASYLNFQDAGGMTALQHACSQGDEVLALALIQAGANFKAEDGEEASVLQIACRQGLSKVVQAVMAQGISEAELSGALMAAYQGMHAADLAVRKGEGASLAVYYQTRSLLLDLIQKVDVNPSAADSNAATVLHLAAADGDMQVVSEVMARGGNLLVTDPSGRTPCQCALKAGHMEVAAFLTSKGGLKTHEDLSKLSDKQYSQFVQALLKMGEVPPMQFLYGALRRQDAALVEVLITACLKNRDNIAKVDTHKRSLADYALMAGDYARAVQLKRAGSPLNMELVNNLKNDPFHLVAMAFITPDPTTGKFTKAQNFIVAAATRGDGVLLKDLIAKGADLNAYNAQDMTPLHVAALKGNARAVATLLDAGADINASSTSSGLTPLHMACYKGHYAVAKLLIARGALTDAVDKHELTPIAYVAENDPAHIRELLQRSPKVHAALQNVRKGFRFFGEVVDEMFS